MAALNVRIDPTTLDLIDRVAHRTGRTRSEVVRDALKTLRARGEDLSTPPPSQAMAKMIGCWDSGGLRLSERTGERFAHMLAEKKDVHRPHRRGAPRRSD